MEQSEHPVCTASRLKARRRGSEAVPDRRDRCLSVCPQSRASWSSFSVNSPVKLNRGSAAGRAGLRNRGYGETGRNNRGRAPSVRLRINVSPFSPLRSVAARVIRARGRGLRAISRGDRIENFVAYSRVIERTGDLSAVRFRVPDTSGFFFSSQIDPNESEPGLRLAARFSELDSVRTSAVMIIERVREKDAHHISEMLLGNVNTIRRSSRGKSNRRSVRWFLLLVK